MFLGSLCAVGRGFLAMERVTGGGVLPLVLASAGALLLYRILVRLRPGAALQDAVVVITGASSGLGKGWPPVHFIFSSAYAFHKSSFLVVNMFSNEQ